MIYQRQDTIERVNDFLDQADLCMANWPESDLAASLRGAISPISQGLRQHIEDDQHYRVELSASAYRAITDAYVIAESDAGKLLLKAITIYDRYE